MSKPSAPTPDYKAMWESYSLWRADAAQAKEKELSTTRAKLAQSGIKEGTASWNARIGAVEKKHADELNTLQTGATAQELKDAAGSLIGGRELALRQQATDELKASSTFNKEDTFSNNVQIYNKLEQLKSKDPMLNIMKTAEDYQNMDKVEQVLTMAWGTSEGTQPTAKEQALTRAKQAAGGGTVTKNLGTDAVTLAEEENKARRQNPWI